MFILYQNFGKELVFKGGTALNIVYGLPRFSEDLDFTLSKEIDIKDIVQHGLNRFYLESEITEKRNKNSFNYIIRIKGPLYIGIKESLCRIELDFSLREKVCLEPKISTIGEEEPKSIIKRKITETLTGLNLLEISTYHLSTKEKQFKDIGIKEFLSNIIEVEESKTENNILRMSLLANSIQVLSENSDASYPQKIFEIGKVFSQDSKYKNSETQISEEERLCISLCHEKANFTEIKQVLDYLMRMLGIEYEIKETQHPSFIEGRTGEIIVNKKPIGILGEILPCILKNNRIKMPVASMEINIKNL